MESFSEEFDLGDDDGSALLPFNESFRLAPKSETDALQLSLRAPCYVLYYIRRQILSHLKDIPRTYLLKFLIAPAI